MAPNRPLIVLTHGYTDSNKGDVAIAFGTVAALRRSLPEAAILSHSNFSEEHVAFALHTRMMARAGIPVVEGVLPSPYLKDEGSGLGQHAAALLRLGRELAVLAILWVFPSLRRLHPRKARALDDIRRADLVVARGGQYLHNDAGPVRGSIYLARMLLNLAVPVWLHRPTVALGLSVGPVHGRFGRRLLTATLRPCRAVVVREALSATFLQSQGLTANVRVAPDSAFLTTPTRSEASTVPAGTWIGVTLINWSFPGHPQPRQARADYAGAVFEALLACHRSLSLTPILVDQVTVSHHGQHDLSLQAEMVERLRGHGVPAGHVTADLTPGEVCDIFGQCRVVLASRLHTVILSACAGTPAVAIRYQGFKTQGILEMLGVAQPAHDIDTVTAAELFASLQRALADRERLSERLQENVVGLRRQFLDTVDEITAALRPPRPGLIL